MGRPILNLHWYKEYLFNFINHSKREYFVPPNGINIVELKKMYENLINDNESDIGEQYFKYIKSLDQDVYKCYIQDWNDESCAIQTHDFEGIENKHIVFIIFSRYLQAKEINKFSLKAIHDAEKPSIRDRSSSESKDHDFITIFHDQHEKVRLLTQATEDTEYIFSLWRKNKELFEFDKSIMKLIKTTVINSDTIYTFELEKFDENGKKHVITMNFFHNVLDPNFNLESSTV